LWGIIIKGGSMNIIQIVTQYLKDNGYDGLYKPDKCGCKLDDLMECENPDESLCEAGYLSKCEDDESTDCDGDCDWHIGPKE
jgi:hypothetical protein